MDLHLHYDELRGRRVMNRDDIVLGRSYLLCHVPLDFVYDMGSDPFCSERKILELRHQSANDVQLSHFEKNLNDPEVIARMKSSTLLNEKFWMFKTDEESSEWSYCADWGLETSRPTVNYILDLQELEEDGITVIRTTAGKYSLSDYGRVTRDLRNAQDLEWEESTLFDD